LIEINYIPIKKVIRFNINNQNDLQSTPLQQQQQQHRIDLNKVKPNSDFVIMEKSVSDSSLALNSKYNNNNIRPHALLKYNFSNTNNSNSESTFNSPSFESSVSPASAANSSSIPFSQLHHHHHHYHHRHHHRQWHRFHLDLLEQKLLTLLLI